MGGNRARGQHNRGRGNRGGRGRGRGRGGGGGYRGGHRNHNPNNSSKHSHHRHKPSEFFAFQQLTTDEALLKLSRDGKEELLKVCDGSVSRPLAVERLLELLSRDDVSSMVQQEALNNVLVVISNSDPFWEGVVAACLRKKERILLQRVIGVMKLVLRRLPGQFARLETAFAVVDLHAKKLNGMYGADKLVAQHGELSELWTACELGGDEEEKEEASGRIDEALPSAPNRFTQLADIPPISDLLQSDSDSDLFFVRSNPLKHSFQDHMEYLDVLYRLTQQDFIRPLNKALRQYVEGRKKDVRVYTKSTLESLTCDNHSGVSFAVRLSGREVKRVRWAQSKRLQYGSLVCVCPSADVSTFLWCVVNERDVRLLKKGKTGIKLQFLDINKALHLLKTCDQFDIVEPMGVYWEAYRPVLQALKTMGDEHKPIPFADTLLRLQPNTPVPLYIQQKGGHLDMSGVFPVNSPAHTSFPVTHTWPKLLQVTPQKLHKLGKSGKRVPTNAPLVTTLDGSQRDALEHILTSQVALVQGPPGTGKTYLTLQALRVLLANCKDQGPVLVVALTNHALDQLLEGISKFEKSIVRVGSRSNCEAMEEFNLKTKRKFYRRGFGKDMGRVLGELEHLEGSIQQASERLRLCRNRFVPLNMLCSVADETHAQQLRHIREQYLREQNKEQADIDELLLKMEECNLDGQEEHKEEEFAFGGVMIGGRVLGAGQKDVDPEVKERLQTQLLELQTQGKQRRKPLERWLMGGQLGDNAQHGQRRLKTLDLRRTQPGVGNNQAQWAFDGESEDEEDLRDAQREEDSRRLDVNDRNNNKGKRGKSDAYSVRVSDYPVSRESFATHCLSEEEAAAVLDIHSLSTQQRARLYNRWRMLLCNDAYNTLEDTITTYDSKSKEKRELTHVIDKHVLKDCRVMGMTSNGACRYQAVLRCIRPAIVVVEEAAELFEAQIISFLNDSVQHLIMVGDHKQLRPSTSSYDMAKNHKLDVSLFEKIMINQIDHAVLATQRRMRPCIRRLTRSIYPGVNIRDHPSVCDYPHVRGMRDNLFFLHHTHVESNNAESLSKSNLHEAKMAVALADYLVKQGAFEPEEITILSTYSGQYFLINQTLTEFAKKHKRDPLQRVQRRVVDKFQGEENRVIILSLVRSNEKDVAGFVKIENRICVALSRAKEGMFVLGNMTMLAGVSPVWQKVCKELQETKAIGDELVLQCHKHSDKQHVVTMPDDFHKVPSGGCNLPCDERLSCGHACRLMCHPDTHERLGVKCYEPCTRTPPECPSEHRCTKKCHQNCGLCLFKVVKQLPCGHQAPLPCHVDPKEAPCPVQCVKRLSCGHDCSKNCTDQCRCGQSKEVTFTCGHSQSLSCDAVRDNPSLAKCCPVLCKEQLLCGHVCNKPCHKGEPHPTCDKPCPLFHPCMHPCDTSYNHRCGDEHPCPPCKAMCAHKCTHCKCAHKCVDKCPPCAEQCTWQCDHFSCTKLCHEPHDRPACDQPCPKLLPCKHECMGVCGEPCPTVCKQCALGSRKEGKKNRKRHNVALPSVYVHRPLQRMPVSQVKDGVRLLQLDDCSHVIEMATLDQYVRDSEDKTMKVKNGVLRMLPQCPVCAVPIRRSARYSDAINRAIQDLEALKGVGFTLSQGLEQYPECLDVMISIVYSAACSPGRLDDGFPSNVSGGGRDFLNCGVPDANQVAECLRRCPSVADLKSFNKNGALRQRLDELDGRLLPLLQWILVSSEARIKLLPKSAPISRAVPCELAFSFVSSTQGREESFQDRKKKSSQVQWGWHGSGLNNWNAIIRGGLKNMSHTNKQVNGAAYGPGVYLAKALQMSLGYARSVDVWPGSGLTSQLLVVLCEVAMTDVQRHSWGYVCPDDRCVATRVLLLNPAPGGTSAEQAAVHVSG